jgi:hypothetical protein
VDAYADREIDRHRPRNGPWRVRRVSTRGAALPPGSTPARQQFVPTKREER